VTATWKLRGSPWLAASIRLSQAAFRLLYLSETSKVEEQLLKTEICAQAWSQIKVEVLPPTNASKVMWRSRSAWKRAVISRRSCSRCRTRRRNW
jgi:hypothetical protein